jgi:hypothetical protein
MDKINKIIFDYKTKIKNNPTKHIIILYILFLISILS